MPEKAEYWNLNGREFRKYKSELMVFGQSLFDRYKEFGFTEFNTKSDWLGFTITKRQQRKYAQIGASLSDAKYPSVTVGLMIYDKYSKNGDSNNLITFKSLDELKSTFTDSPSVIDDKLKHVLQQNL